MADQNGTPSPAATPPADGAVTLELASTQIFGKQPTNQSPTQTPTPQPTDGQAPAAPTSGKGDGTGKSDGTGTADPKGQAADVSDEELLAAMSPQETPEAQLAKLKRDAGASRKEALRLKKVSDGTKAVLAEQGIDLVLDDDGSVIGFAPNDKYNKGSASNLSLKFTDFTAEQQEEFESKPQALIDHVLKLATSRLVRAVPTVEKRAQPLSPEQEQSAMEHVAGLLLSDGETKKHPNLDKNMALIRQQLDAPSNRALREFYFQQPDLALALLDAAVDKTRAMLAAKAQAMADAKTKKQQVADSSVSPAPSGGGQATVIPADASIEEQGRAWSKAFAAAD